MFVALNVVQKFMAPALAGLCMAAVASGVGVIGTAVTAVIALASLYISLPAGERLISRIARAGT